MGVELKCRRRWGTAPALALACIFVTQTTSARSGGQAAAENAQAEFDALIARVKQSDESVDFLRLRRLYAESGTFTPYRDDAEESMIAAAGAGQDEAALKIAREILARNYMNIEAHMASTVVCTNLGDAMCAAHHGYAARGMLKSILASGDGKTPATAFVVVNTPEEYAIVRVLGVRVVSQSLMRSADGHAYDVLTVRDAGTGQESLLYFNVDVALAAMGRVFGLK